MSRKGYLNRERTICYCSREQSGTGYLSIFIREKFKWCLWNQNWLGREMKIPQRMVNRLEVYDDEELVVSGYLKEMKSQRGS